MLEVRIDKVVAEGDGLGRDDAGKVVFVEGALPGELVRARIVSESKDYGRAVAVDIIEPNDRRAVAPCRFVTHGCGGCDLQHADPELQIEIKRDIVEESLRRLGGIQRPDVRIGSRTSTAMNARTTVRIAGAPSGVGFRRRRSHDIVPIDTCLVAHPRINEIIADLELAPDAQASIRVSSTTGEAIIWVEPDGGLVRRPADVSVGAGSSVSETIAGFRFRISAGSFFQSSPGAATALVESVARALGPAETWREGPVVDAYGGVGLFAATVVPQDRRVIVIETNPLSCADARVNLVGRRVDLVESRVEDWNPESVAVVIADPARDGLRREAVDVLTAGSPDLFVLVSCDPASLGRDARLLEAKGYHLDYSEVLDAFGHTHHVEVVSRFVSDVGMVSP